MSSTYREIACPQCGSPTYFHPDNAYRPFCSARCRLIDLGQWANEQYSIPEETPPLDFDAAPQ